MGPNYILKLQLKAFLEFVGLVDEIPRPFITVNVLLLLTLNERQNIRS
jgi:hypothetical protein